MHSALTEEENNMQPILSGVRYLGEAGHLVTRFNQMNDSPEKRVENSEGIVLSLCGGCSLFNSLAIGTGVVFPPFLFLETILRSVQLGIQYSKGERKPNSREIKLAICQTAIEIISGTRCVLESENYTIKTFVAERRDLGSAWAALITVELALRILSIKAL